MIFILINIKNQILDYAEKNNFHVKEEFVEMLAKGKLKIFGKENWKFCTCDRKNPERFCGGPLCSKDIKEKGNCHLYYKKS